MKAQWVLILEAGSGGGFLLTHRLEGQEGSGAAVLRENMRRRSRCACTLIGSWVQRFLCLSVRSPGFSLSELGRRERLRLEPRLP